MKKIIFILLILLCSIVSADHYFLGDDDSAIDSVIDELKITGFLKSGDYDLVDNDNIGKDDLDNKVTTIIHKGTAVVIIGENSPAEHVIMAGEIAKYLKAEEGYKLLPAMTSDEVKYNDLTLIFGNPVKCVDSDDDYYSKGKATGVNTRGDIVTEYDSCEEGKLLEMYCDDNILKVEYKTCECENGKCIKEEVKEEIVVEEKTDTEKPIPTLYDQQKEDIPVVEEIEETEEEIKNSGMFARLWNWFTGWFG